MRRLVVCSDGTWNDPSSNTNVYRLKNRLARHEQLCFYDPGVGTGRVRVGRQTWLKNQFDRIGGGAFGAGLSGNVQEAYRWIAENYEEDDQLWFFGFSRGAFTVRSTVGFIRKVGLLRPPVDDRVLAEGYNIYRKADPTPDTEEAKAFRLRHNTRAIDRLNIHFVGVWDTVGTLGVPGSVLGRVSQKRWGFHDYRLSSHVKHAYQALAIDELRAAFLPAAWAAPFDPGQKVEQTWFAGTHSDVGGEAGEIALRWLGEKAEAAGLVFDPPVSEWPDPGSPRKRPQELKDRWWRTVCGQALRPVGDPVHGPVTLHASLEALFAGSQDYRPKNLVRYKQGDAMTKPEGRKWWYTLPGANEYFLEQYERTHRG